MGASQAVETEIKLPMPDQEGLLTKLGGLGFHLSTPRLFEANTLYDYPDARLRNHGELVRLRQIADRWILTFKGRATDGKHKSREERETTVGDGEVLALILTRLGLQPTFRYEKYRTEYSDGEGTLTVDETPIGGYLELEGPSEWIDRRAVELGYNERDYVTKSYGRLYLDYCEQRGCPPGHMVFERLPEAP